MVHFNWKNKRSANKSDGVTHEKFKISNPANPCEVKEVENWLEKTSDNYFYNKTQEILIGASGTFETFYELIFNDTFPKVKKCIELPIYLLSDELDKIIYSTDQERNLNEYLIPIRKKLAPIAAIKKILRAITLLK